MDNERKIAATVAAMPCDASAGVYLDVMNILQRNGYKVDSPFFDPEEVIHKFVNREAVIAYMLADRGDVFAVYTDRYIVTDSPIPEGLVAKTKCPGFFDEGNIDLGLKNILRNRGLNRVKLDLIESLKKNIQKEFNGRSEK